MICYRGKTFCADQDVCRVQQCKDRLTEAEREMALDSGLPVAWAHFGQLCSRFSPSAPNAGVNPRREAASD